MTVRVLPKNGTRIRPGALVIEWKGLRAHVGRWFGQRDFMLFGLRFLRGTGRSEFTCGTTPLLWNPDNEESIVTKMTSVLER